VKLAILRGQDPIAARKQAQAKATAPGWLQVRDEYLAHLQRRLLNRGSLKNEHVRLAHVFSVIDPRRPLREIGIREVATLTDKLPQGAVGAHAVSALGRLLDWARAREIVDTANPVRLLPRGARPRRPPPRRRMLSLDELSQLWRVADRLAPIERDLLRLLIAVPLRRSEVGSIEWGWIDRGTNTINMPESAMKEEDHVLPLGALARGVLGGIAKRTSSAADGRTAASTPRSREVETWPTAGRVFKTANVGVVNWWLFKRRIDELVSLEPAWTFHDFRRSFVSLLAERGHHEAVLDQMISHKQSATRSGVLGIYQRSQRLPEQRRAMMEWDALIAGALGGTAGSGVAAILPFKQVS
jgi:integrase